MCGITGYTGEREAPQILLEGLKRLEYRGYDSAGMAVIDGGKVKIKRNEGKLDQLERSLYKDPLRGKVGIGHTRWATHGKPSETNAHPHKAGSIVVVHNGIIENYLDLKKILGEKGYKIETAGTGQEAIRKAEEKFFNLALLDIKLPDIEGTKLLATLKRLHPHIDVIIVTGYASLENTMQALNGGGVFLHDQTNRPG